MVKEVVEIAAALLGAVYVFGFIRFWRNEARNLVKESGYAPPIPRLWAILLGALVTRLVSGLLIGKIRIVGGEKAKQEEKKWLYVAVFNHQIPIDAVVASKLAKHRRWRFMVAMEEVRRPFLAPLYAIVGAIPVIRRNSEAAKDTDSPTRAAAAAVLGAVNALKSDREAGPKEKGVYATIALTVLSAMLIWLQLWWIAAPVAIFASLRLLDLFSKRPTHFAIFPQGKLVPKDELKVEDFHPGPVKIARRVAKATGLPVALLAGHIAYDKDRAHASLGTRFLEAVHFPRLLFGYGPVYGATLTLSDPIPVDSLSTRDDEAARQIYEHILRLKNSSQG